MYVYMYMQYIYIYEQGIYCSTYIYISSLFIFFKTPVLFILMANQSKVAVLSLVELANNHWRSGRFPSLFESENLFAAILEGCCFYLFWTSCFFRAQKWGSFNPKKKTARPYFGRLGESESVEVKWSASKIPILLMCRCFRSHTVHERTER